ALRADDSQLAQEFAATHPSEVATLSLAQNPGLANQQAPGFAGLTYAVAAQQILQRGEHGPFPIFILAEDIAARLLAQGINPGGFTKDVLWTNPRRREEPWRRLYEWQSGEQPAPRVNPPLALLERGHLQLIRETAFREV